MRPLYLLFVALVMQVGWAQSDQNKKPVVNMIFESPEMYKTLKSILNRTFIKHDHTGDGSGVYLGSTSGNLGLVLTAAHVVRKSADGRQRVMLPAVDGIPRHPERPEHALSLQDFFFGRFYGDSKEGRQRVGVPYFSPELDLVQEGAEHIDYIYDDYALALVGQTVKSGATVTELFSNPSNENPPPQLPPLKIAAPVAGETLIAMGGLNRYNADELYNSFWFGTKEEFLKALPKVKEYYSIAQVADYDKAWLATSQALVNAPYDPTVEFFMEGDVAEHGMSGGGVFNLKGELVGLIIQADINQTTKKINWVRAIRADYIYNSILAKSKNPEVLKAFQETAVGLSCSSLL